MSDKNFGVINEQGYPAGQFGFKPLNEDDKRNIEKSEKDNDKKEKE